MTGQGVALTLEQYISPQMLILRVLKTKRWDEGARGRLSASRVRFQPLSEVSGDDRDVMLHLQPLEKACPARTDDSP